LVAERAFQPDDDCYEDVFPAQTFSPDQMIGTYTLELVKSDSTWTLSFMLRSAQQPVILPTEDGYKLVGFQRGEDVRLIGYRSSGFAGEWHVHADKDGVVQVAIDPRIELVAIGAAGSIGDKYLSRLWQYKGSFRRGDFVEVITATTLLSEDFRERQQLSPGTKMQLISSPSYADGRIRWHVRLEDGATGWVDETERSFR
jgi:hypothetical protein